MPGNKSLKASDNTKLKEEIINDIQPKLQESFSVLKEDLLNDIHELIEKKTYKPNTEAPKGGSINFEEVMKAIKGNDGNMDLSKIGQLMASQPMPQNMPDMKDMSEGQIAFMKQQQQNQMLMTVLPAVLGQQQQHPLTALFQEMMQRNFLDTIVDASIQRKTIQNALAKKMGMEISSVDVGLMNPVVEATKNLGKQAVNNGQ